MTRTLAAVAYWFAAVTITLGSIGHGFLGVKAGAHRPGRRDPSARHPACVLDCVVLGKRNHGVFGLLLFWAWPALKAGSSSRSAPPLIIGVSYVIAGIVCFLYTKHDPFWLLFLTQGVPILGSTWVFTQGKTTAGRSDQQ